MKTSYIPIPAPHNNRDYRDDMVWRHRRAIKVYPTSNTHDIARCYETIPRGMYAHNLELAKMSPYKYGRRQYYRYGNITYVPFAKDPVPIHPENIERQLVGSRVPKRQMRGGPAVKRRRNLCTRTIKTGRVGDLGDSKSNEVVSSQRTDERSKTRGHEISRQNRFVENYGPWSGACQRLIEEDDFEEWRDRIREGSFNDDSDWIDVNNDYRLNSEVEFEKEEDYVWLRLN